MILINEIYFSSTPPHIFNSRIFIDLNYNYFFENLNLSIVTYL